MHQYKYTNAVGLVHVYYCTTNSQLQDMAANGTIPSAIDHSTKSILSPNTHE